MPWFLTPHGPHFVVEPGTIDEYERRDYVVMTAQQAADYFAGVAFPDPPSFATEAEVPGIMATVAADAGSAFSVAQRAAFVPQDVLLFDVKQHGAKGDGTADDYTAIQAAIQAAYDAGGGIVTFPRGIYRCNTRLRVPNDGENQPSITLLGVGGTWTGDFSADPNLNYGSVLDVRDASGPAKLSTYGHGLLTVQGLTFADRGTTPTVAPYLQTTATTVMVRNNAFVGHSSLTGQACTQDAIILGGTENAPGPRETAAFHGYGSIVEANYFHRIRRGVYGRSRANSNKVAWNTWSSKSGATTTEAAIELDATGTECNANHITGNLFEVTNYPYAIKAISSNQNIISENACWDPSASTVALLRLEGTSDQNEVNGNHWPTGNAWDIISDVSTGQKRVRGRSRSTFLGGFTAMGGKDENAIRPLYATGDENARLFGVFRSAAEATNPSGVIYSVTQAGEARLYGTNPKFALPEGSIRHATGSLQILRDTAGEIRLDPGAGGYVRQINGSFRLPSFTTANRPTTNLGAGAVIWDSTLGKPVYYNGTGWVDSTGTAV